MPLHTELSPTLSFPWHEHRYMNLLSPAALSQGTGDLLEDKESLQGCTHCIVLLLGFIPFSSLVTAHTLSHVVPTVQSVSWCQALTLGSQLLVTLHPYPSICHPAEVPSRAQHCSLRPLRHGCATPRRALHPHPWPPINHSSAVTTLEQSLPSLCSLRIKLLALPFITTTGFITHFIR